MKKAIIISALCAACALSLWALTVQGSLNILGTLTASVVDMSAATSTRPVKEAASDPATCTEGMRYYNTALHKGRLCTSTNTWADEAGSGGASFDPLDMRSAWWRDDFFAFVPSGGSVYSDQTWSYRDIGSPSGQAITQGNGSADNPGVLQIATGTVANTGLIVSTDSYNYDHGRFNLRASGQEACVAVALSATTQFKARIGITLTGEGYNVTDSANKAWFYYNATASASTWQMKVEAYGGTAGTYDTGVTADTGFHSACWRTDGTKVYMRWDGGTEHSFCLSGCDTAATIPDGSSNKYSLGFAAITLDTTSKNLLVDFAAYNRAISTANARKRN